MLLRPRRPAGSSGSGAERLAGSGDESGAAVRAERPHRQAGRRGLLGFSGKKGEPIVLELRAQQLGSPLQGVLTVCDGQGKELARAESAAAQPDPSLTFTPPAAAPTPSASPTSSARGGPEFAYPPRPRAARLRFPAATRCGRTSMPAGGQAELKITADRLGGSSIRSLWMSTDSSGVRGDEHDDRPLAERGRITRRRCDGGHRRRPPHGPRR